MSRQLDRVVHCWVWRTVELDTPIDHVAENLTELDRGAATSDDWIDGFAQIADADDGFGLGDRHSLIPRYRPHDFVPPAPYFPDLLDESR